MSRSVGAVARLSGVSVRTLHHYDRLGLLTPSGRNPAGYRRYGDADIDRLHRILYYRELGFSLEKIGALISGEEGGTLHHLQAQRVLLGERIGRLQQMVVAIEKEMEADRMGIKLTDEERFEVFGNFNPDDHAAEAEERWGDTDAYRESARRTASYTKADWERLKAEGQAVTDRLVRAMQAGLPADGQEAMDAAEAHREQISRWFYPCSLAIHTALAETYVADPRFAANYERVASGLAQYLHDAIVANASRQATEG